MTKFEELQAAHEKLLEQSKAPADVAAFVTEVQREIEHMRAAAEDIAAPRERDQLRAILRFWASYIYDHTGTYPDTTPRPANSAPPPPPPQYRTAIFWSITALATIALIVAVMALLSGVVPGGTESAPASFTPISTPGASVIVVATAESPITRAPEITSSILTAGPSPFDPNVWAAHMQLTATGGNGNYIFWLNGKRLPDISENQFTVEGSGCDPQIRVVGVTSGGQATSVELTIQSPLPECRK